MIALRGRGGVYLVLKLSLALILYETSISKRDERSLFIATYFSLALVIGFTGSLSLLRPDDVMQVYQSLLLQRPVHRGPTQIRLHPSMDLL